jgi:hypothetical protein
MTCGALAPVDLATGYPMTFTSATKEPLPALKWVLEQCMVPCCFIADNAFNTVATRTLLTSAGISLSCMGRNEPKANGFGERAQRGIGKIAKCLLLQSGIPMNFWGAAYIHARTFYACMPSAMYGITPYEGMVLCAPPSSGNGAATAACTPCPCHGYP